MTRRVTININYPGSIISVNHYKYAGGRFTRKETKAWMTKLGWLIKSYHIEDWTLPLEITCGGFFKDERSAPDVHNLLKVIADAIQEVSGINDKNYHMTAGKREIVGNIVGNREAPYLLITISESATPPIIVPTKSSRKGSKVSGSSKLKRKRNDKV